MIRELQLELHPGTYVYCCVPHDFDTHRLESIMVFREREGQTLVVREDVATQAGLAVMLRVRWITLRVNSQLTDVGLTAAFAGALATAGISCNVVAAAHHDHLFVPESQAAGAMLVLESLQQEVEG